MCKDCKDTVVVGSECAGARPVADGGRSAGTTVAGPGGDHDRGRLPGYSELTKAGGTLVGLDAESVANRLLAFAVARGRATAMRRNTLRGGSLRDHVTFAVPVEPTDEADARNVVTLLDGARMFAEGPCRYCGGYAHEVFGAPAGWWWTARQRLYCETCDRKKECNA